MGGGGATCCAEWSRTTSANLAEISQKFGLAYDFANSWKDRLSAQLTTIIGLMSSDIHVSHVMRDIRGFFGPHMPPKRKVNRDTAASPSDDSVSVSDGSDFEGRPHKKVARGTGKKAAAVKPKASAGPCTHSSSLPACLLRRFRFGG